MSEHAYGLELSELRLLAERPFALESLEALSTAPLTVTELAGTLRCSGRTASLALRAVAAFGLVIGHEPGSWDNHCACQRFTLTTRGRRAVAALSHFPVWIALHESTDTPGSTDEVLL
ncbi:hypothetical protein C5E45_19130 [Nocardia nova]|uniref:MarR family transcriptional regulator n=1 Tax=Nocardia nova TaxID=37330 RepID=A0A2S6AMW4_9NOCA|nr:hypothetical protein [Nocardia nova]PPJ36543.1 hypothetical protein C5E45_19130 [Nocardia nova]